MQKSEKRAKIFDDLFYNKFFKFFVHRYIFSKNCYAITMHPHMRISREPVLSRSIVSTNGYIMAFQDT